VFAEAELTLEQCRRAARPGFALCFGDASDIINVGACLRKDVVQVVADADEAEAFVEKLSDTRGAEEKRPRMTLFLRASATSLSVAAPNSGEVYMCGEFVFFIEAHGHAKIVLAEKENIHAGNRSDFRQVLDAVRGFDL